MTTKAAKHISLKYMACETKVKITTDEFLAWGKVLNDNKKTYIVLVRKVKRLKDGKVFRHSVKKDIVLHFPAGEVEIVTDPFNAKKMVITDDPLMAELYASEEAREEAIGCFNA